MKEIHKIIEELSGDKQKDSIVLVGYLNEYTKTENEYFQQLDVFKLLKKYCEQDINLFNKYKDVLIKYDITFFEYYTKKFNTCIAQKKYEMALFYVNKTMWFYDFPQNHISFDNKLDYFLFKFWHQNFNGNFIFSVESLVYLHFAIVCLGLNDIDMAIRAITHSMECSPMNFTYYEKAMSIFAQYGYLNDLKNCLESAYNIIKDDNQLGVIQYYWAKYFFLNNKYVLAKVCINLAMSKNINLSYKKDMIDLINKMDKTNIVSFDFVGDYTEILEKNSVPTKRKIEFLYASAIIYSKCLKKEIRDKSILSGTEKIIKSYNVPQFLYDIKNSVLTGNELYIIHKQKIYFLIDKKWDITINTKDKTATLFSAVNESNYFVVNYFYKNKCKNVLDKNTNYNNLVEKQEFTTIKNKKVFYYILKNDETNSFTFVAQFDISNDILGTMSASFIGDIFAKKNEFLDIISSISVLPIK